jgi:hypothetical protein
MIPYIHIDATARRPAAHPSLRGPRRRRPPRARACAFERQPVRAAGASRGCAKFRAARVRPRNTLRSAASRRLFGWTRPRQTGTMRASPQGGAHPWATSLQRRKKRRRSRTLLARTKRRPARRRRSLSKGPRAQRRRVARRSAKRIARRGLPPGEPARGRVRVQWFVGPNVRDARARRVRSLSCVQQAGRRGRSRSRTRCPGR